MDDDSLPLPDSGGCVLSIPLPELAGESFSVVALEDGTLIIEDQEGEAPLDGVATVIERRVEAPYRARGFRQDARRWVVVADPIDVVDLGSLTGNTVTVVALGEENRVSLDGRLLTPAEIPEELRLEIAAAEPCVLSASNVDEQWWELTVEELPEELALEPDAGGETPAADA